MEQTLAAAVALVVSAREQDYLLQQARNTQLPLVAAVLQTQAAPVLFSHPSPLPVAVAEDKAMSAHLKLVVLVAVAPIPTQLVPQETRRL